MRVAIYGRVSTEKQEKQETVNSQLEALREYIKKNHYTIYGEYIDEGYSGELLDRPALDKLRDDAKNKLFDIVLVHSPDRLSRKFIYLGLLQEELKKFGVNTVFLNRPESKDTPEDKLLNNIQGVISEYEKAKILERTRRGKIHKANSGFLVTSQAPYGYKYIQCDKSRNIPGHYEIVDKETKIVKLIFNLFINKQLSIRAIAKELTRKDIPPKKGKYWRTSSLHRIIRNETYTGVTYYNKHISVETDNHNNGNKYRRTKNTGRRLRPKSEWIAISLPDDLKIIDKKTFNSAQKQIKKNSELSPRNTKYQYLLRGLIKCGNCDSPFYGTPYHGELFYRCGNKHRTFPLPKVCKVSSVKADKLENLVWDKFCEAIRKPRLIKEQISKLQDRTIKSTDSIKKDIASIDREFKDTETEQERLLEAYTQKIISLEQLKLQMERIQSKKDKLEQEKQALINKQENTLSPIFAKRTIDEYCNLIERRLKGLQGDFEGKRYLLTLAINKIVLEGKKVRIKGIIPVYNQESAVLCNIKSTSSAHCVPLLLQLQVLVLRVPAL